MISNYVRLEITTTHIQLQFAKTNRNCMKENVGGYDHSQPSHNYPQLKAAQTKTCFLILSFHIYLKINKTHKTTKE